MQHVPQFGLVVIVHISVLFCTRFIFISQIYSPLAVLPQQLVLNDLLFSWIIRETIRLSTTNTFPSSPQVIHLCLQRSGLLWVYKWCCPWIDSWSREQMSKISWNQRPRFANRVDIRDKKKSGRIGQCILPWEKQNICGTERYESDMTISAGN